MERGLVMKQIFIIFFSLFIVACGNEQLEVETVHPEKAYISGNSSVTLPAFEKVKKIKDGIFQGVTKEEIDGADSINFYTWKNNDPWEIIDIISYDDIHMSSSLEIGYFYLSLWNEVEDFFLSYHDLHLSPQFLEEAKKGFMIHSKIGIGSTEEQLLSTLGPPHVQDWFHGGLLYVYSDLSYILNDHLQIVAILMPGNRINIPLKEVPTILGSPYTIDYSEKDRSFIYTYEAGSYLLQFEALDEEQNVMDVWLVEK